MDSHNWRASYEEIKQYKTIICEGLFSKSGHPENFFLTLRQYYQRMCILVIFGLEVISIKISEYTWDRLHRHQKLNLYLTQQSYAYVIQLFVVFCLNHSNLESAVRPKRSKLLSSKEHLISLIVHSASLHHTKALIHLSTKKKVSFFYKT